MPVSPTMFKTTVAKKLFSPMPGAIAKGLLATNAITKIPIADAIQVARKTPFQSSLPSAPKFVSRFGFRAIMYAIVMNVVRPAITSVFAVVLFSLSLNNFSNMFCISLLCFLK